jgi:ribokinase
MDGMEMLYSSLHTPFPGNALFKDAGGPVLVCKMGKNGAEFYSKKLVFELPAEKVEKIVDNTGAGDAFNAGFLDAVLRGAGARECLRSGINLAALSLSGYGRDWLKGMMTKHA